MSADEQHAKDRAVAHSRRQRRERGAGRYRRDAIASVAIAAADHVATGQDRLEYVPASDYRSRVFFRCNGAILAARPTIDGWQCIKKFPDGTVGAAQYPGGYIARDVPFDWRAPWQ